MPIFAIMLTAPFLLSPARQSLIIRQCKSRRVGIVEREGVANQIASLECFLMRLTKSALSDETTLSV
jgi:hypothetical protein